MKKIVTVLGARPQFVKAACVSREFHEHEAIEETIVHTGQHFDDNMSSIFFDQLKVPPPTANLGISGGSHGRMTGAMLIDLEKFFEQSAPDLVLVYGDTNSTLAGALAAAKMSIPVAHIEAGLRSNNTFQPEEINRCATDAVSQLLFAPTLSAFDLLGRVISRGQAAYFSGDVMQDAVRVFQAAAAENSTIIKDMKLVAGDYVLATVHRAENTDNAARLEDIFRELISIAGKVPVVVPLHPRTRIALEKSGLLDWVKGSLLIIEPVGYLDMYNLLASSLAVITDSGGVQKEAYFHNRPCVTLRDETEWVELVEAGCNFLCTPARLPEVFDAALKVPQERFGDTRLFGDGYASKKIAGHIAEFLGA